MLSKGLWLASVLMVLAAGVVVPGAARGKARKPMPRDVVGYFWVPEGDTSPYWTVADHSDAISVLAPTWLSFDASGAFHNSSDARLVRWAHGHGIKVTPLVANAPFKPEVARPIFETDEAIARN